MCGIAGIFDPRIRKNWDIEIKKMVGCLKHRGPDQEGFYIDSREGIYFGHSRLSIIDLSERGRQPFFNEDGTIAVIVNGEIYNFQNLRNLLRLKGHQFKSKSDSEVIVHAYEEWGERCVERFRGMFAYAIWDANENKLILARDRLGIKPLYVTNINGAFIFSSETKSFLMLDEFIPQIDSSSLALYLEFSYIPHQTKTSLKGVEKFPPGHVGIFRKDGKVLQKYWDLQVKEIDNNSFEHALNNLSETMMESVRLRLIADVPIGILLSGGLDSSTITVLARAVDPDFPIQTFTVGSDNQIDERPFARKVSELVKSQHHELEVHENDIINEFDRICWFLDDLIADGGAFNTYLMAKKIKGFGLKVLLVGEGADEIFGGYSWYKYFFDPKIRHRMNLVRIHRMNLIRIWRWYSMITTFRFGRGLLYFKRLVSGISKSVGGDFFKTLQNYDLKFQLPNDLLMKVDKMTMAHSIEARVPYLDHELVEFVYNLPIDLKVLAGRRKVILRELAAMKNVPPEICSRPKLGFQFPIENWLTENVSFMEFARDILLQQNGVISEIGYTRFVKKFFESTSRSTPDIFTIWRLLVLSVWHSYYGKKKIFAA